ncbi:hypothetical protein R6Q59_001636 [Mikania micrantha]
MRCWIGQIIETLKTAQVILLFLPCVFKNTLAMISIQGDNDEGMLKFLIPFRGEALPPLCSGISRLINTRVVQGIGDGAAT